MNREWRVTIKVDLKHPAAHEQERAARLHAALSERSPTMGLSGNEIHVVITGRGNDRASAANDAAKTVAETLVAVGFGRFSLTPEDAAEVTPSPSV